VDGAVFLYAQRPDNHSVARALAEHEALFNELFEVVRVFCARALLQLARRKVLLEMRGNLKRRRRPGFRDEVEDFFFLGSGYC